MSILLLALATALSAEVLLALQPGKCVRLISGAFFKGFCVVFMQISSMAQVIFINLPIYMP